MGFYTSRWSFCINQKYEIINGDLSRYEKVTTINADEAPQIFVEPHCSVSDVLWGHDFSRANGD